MAFEQTDERIISEARKAHALSAEDRRALLTKKATAMKERGYSNTAIARELFLNESSVRTLLKEEPKSGS